MRYPQEKFYDDKNQPFNITVTAHNSALFKNLPQNYVGAMFILFFLITNKH